jgi:hypothetical protein
VKTVTLAALAQISLYLLADALLYHNNIKYLSFLNVNLQMDLEMKLTMNGLKALLPAKVLSTLSTGEMCKHMRPNSTRKNRVMPRH